MGANSRKETSQKIVSSIASVAYVAILVVSALDHRSRWSTVPLSVVIAGDVLIALGFTIIFFVFKENPFTSATIELAAGQKSSIDGTLRSRAAPDVQRSPCLPFQHADRARFVVGVVRRHADDARAYLETSC